MEYIIVIWKLEKYCLLFMEIHWMDALYLICSLVYVSISLNYYYDLNFLKKHLKTRTDGIRIALISCSSPFIFILVLHILWLFNSKIIVCVFVNWSWFANFSNWNQGNLFITNLIICISGNNSINKKAFELNKHLLFRFICKIILCSSLLKV